MLESTYVGDERRRSERLPAFIPIRMDGTRDERVGAVTSGMTRDVSEQGLLIRTRRQFTVGAPVTIVVQLDDASGTRNLPGVVVRMADNAADPGGLWPYEVAVRLDQPEPALRSVGLVDDGS